MTAVTTPTTARPPRTIIVLGFAFFGVKYQPPEGDQASPLIAPCPPMCKDEFEFDDWPLGIATDVALVADVLTAPRPEIARNSNCITNGV